MPELKVSGQASSLPVGSNLLDALLANRIAVPYSCRAGSCHACMVRCVSGEPLDAKPEALSAAQREQGWRLACQCRVVDDLGVEVYDPLRDGLPATVVSVEWPGASVVRLRLMPERPLRYRPGQHLLLWTVTGTARPYSLASVAGDDPWLEFHIDCRHRGAFSDAVRELKAGDALRLGELRGGALHYDPDWQQRPLLLMAAGTGLAPLYGVLREALRQGHEGEIRLLHIASQNGEHYLAHELNALAAAHPHVQIQLVNAAELPAALAELRLVSRQTIALLCGQPANVEAFSRRLYLAGLPRSQLYADLFLPHA